MKRKILGFVLFIISLVLIFWNIEFSFTGNVIREYFNGQYIFLHLLGIAFFVVSIFILNVKNQGLEYLVIPTGWEKDRIPRAREELDKGKIDKIIITGHVDKGKIKGSHREKIYKAMREYGVKPSKMGILNGIDSEEDVLYLGKMLKKGDGVNFDTFPLHYLEYKTLIDKAKRDGNFPKGIRVKNAKTKQGIKEVLYGIAGWGEELLSRRKLDYVKDRKTNRFSESYSSIKEYVKKILR